MKESKAVAALDRLYAELPAIRCRGLCADQCTVIALSSLERRRLGPAFTQGTSMICPLLQEGRCSRYRLRPMLCRLYGVTEGMECQAGCVPERYLSREEGYRYLERAEQISQETW